MTTPTPDTAIAPDGSGKSSRKLPRHPLTVRKKLFFSAVFTTLVVVGFEGLLAVMGVRPATYDDDPYVGFAGRLPLFVEASGEDSHPLMTTARNKLTYFNTQSFPRKKAAGTVRIFGVGGSTTYGHPYDDRTSFCGWLRELLPAADPSRNWEVINAGGISYASYRIAALMEELRQYEPDVFIVYDGHNEFLEHRTYQQLREGSVVVRELGAALSRTRTGSLVERGFRAIRPPRRPNTLAAEVDTVLDNALDDAIGPEAYHRDDAQRDAIYEHFRLNLTRMVQIARAGGAQVIFVTPASKLRDCEPFRSEPIAGLSDAARTAFQSTMSRGEQLFADQDWAAALSAFDEALAIDGRYAHAHFSRARALDRLGRTAEAKTAYWRSVDEDVCPLRAPQPLQQIMRDVAAQFSVPLFDHVLRVGERAADGIPGEGEFLDHVHPTIDENRQIALELIKVLTDMGVSQPGPTWGEGAIRGVRERVESGLNPQEHGNALCTVAQVYNWAGRVEESGKLAQRALELVPDNAEAHFLAGYAAAEQGHEAVAVDHYREAVRLHPTHWVAQSNLGKILEKRGDIPAAIQHLELALQAKPDYALAHNNLGRAHAAAGDLDEALAHLLEAVRLRPEYAGAHENLGLVYAKRGNMQQAAAALTRATTLNPSSSSAFSNLGSALANLGDLAGAEQAFRTALELDPKSEHARRSLEQLKSLSR